MTESGVMDTVYMQRALRLAKRGLYTTDPNPRVGCVLVNGGKIVGEGWHQRAGQPHAEIIALKQAGDSAKGSTVYLSLEPCSHTGKTPPCVNALIAANVKQVVVAMVDPNPLVSGNGLKALRDNGIAVSSGLLETQARELNPGFIKRMETGLPFVRVKMAMSLDGRTAMASGESQWITGEAARHDVQKLRARSAAILTGIGTVLSDDPSMNVRLSADELGIEGEVRQPLRVVLDSHNRFPGNCKMIQLSGDVLVFTTDSPANENADYEIVKVASENNRVDLTEAMQLLSRREINEIHVEAGSKLCGALLNKQLVDEIIIYMAPHIMGDEAKGLFSMPGLSNMKDRLELDIADVRAVGKDMRITVKPVYAA